MANLKSYTAEDRRKDVGWGALGVIGVLGILWLVSDDRDDQDAGYFPDLWELMDPNAMTYALIEGRVTQAEIQHVIDSGRAVNIEAAVALLGQANDMLDDDERDVLAACMRPSYPELLLFTSMFTDQEGVSPGAFILTFMDTDDDTSILAEITRHVLRLRRNRG